LVQHRTLFTIERDSIRTALAHYDAEGRKQEMWPFLDGICQPVLEQYASSYADKFDKKYLTAHFTELANPTNPTGYMYFMCRWIQMGMDEAENLTSELTYLADLASP